MSASRHASPATEPSLPDKILLAHRALDRASVPHAFGGALALAAYAEPRATADIDLNVFLPPEDATRVLTVFADLGADTASAAPDPATDGQTRLPWGRTPVDLFFAYDPFHLAAARAVRELPFGNDALPVLAPDHLAVCKVVFNRPKDWTDIDAMLAEGTRLDAAEVLRWTGRIIGDDDPRYDRIAALLSR